LIAGLMAERVIDALEVVTVQVEDTVLGLARSCAGALHTVAEQLPVGKSGQCVVQSLVGQPLLKLMAVADIGHIDHDPVDCRVTKSIGQLHPDVTPFTVQAKEARLDLRHCAVAAGRHSLPCLCGMIAIFGVNHPFESGRRALSKELLAERRGDERDLTSPVHHHDAITGVLDQSRQPSFPPAHSLLSLL
jgi:hypothetical protein